MRRSWRSRHSTHRCASSWKLAAQSGHVQLYCIAQMLQALYILLWNPLAPVSTWHLQVDIIGPFIKQSYTWEEASGKNECHYYPDRRGSTRCAAHAYRRGLYITPQIYASLSLLNTRSKLLWRSVAVLASQHQIWSKATSDFLCIYLLTNSNRFCVNHWLIQVHV